MSDVGKYFVNIGDHLVDISNGEPYHLIRISINKIALVNENTGIAYGIKTNEYCWLMHVGKNNAIYMSAIRRFFGMPNLYKVTDDYEV